MITARQAELLGFVVREMAQGRDPSFREMADALGLSSRARAHDMWRQLRSRLGDDRIAAMLPRAPDGAALRFIPIRGQS